MEYATLLVLYTACLGISNVLAGLAILHVYNETGIAAVLVSFGVLLLFIVVAGIL